MDDATDPPVNYVLIPFERNTNPGKPTDIKLSLQATKQIDKEYEKLDISFSNAKDIIYHFLSISIKCGWGRLALMVKINTGAKFAFKQVYQIQLSDIKHQSH